MLLFFLFSKEKKKSNSWENFLKKIDGRTMFAPTDLRGKRHNNNVNRLHKRQSKKQRYRYRKGQTKAFASPRRTARETSDSAGRVEQVLPRAVFPGTTGRCGLLSLGKSAVAISAGRRAGHRPLHFSFQGKQIDSSALSGISSKRGDFCSKRPECQHCTYRKGQTKAFASPRRTARNERFRRTG